MKFAVGLCGLVLILLAGGCAEPAYSGYGGNVYGEYQTPYTYGPSTSGYVYPAPYYYHYAPYDRDHYWDRGRYWDRHHYPYNSGHWD